MLFCPELMGKAFFSQLKAWFQSRAVNKPRPNNRNTFFKATYHNIVSVLATFVTCCNMLGVIGSSKKTLYFWSAIELISDFLRTLLNYKQSLFIFDSFLLLVLAEFAEILDRKIWLVQVVYLRVTARTLTSFLLSGCLQLSTNLGKYFFRSLLCWYFAIILPTL